MTFPQCDDLEACQSFEEGGAFGSMLFAFDIKAARPVIPVQEEDWALQSFRLEEEDELLVNMVGTFGVASPAVLSPAVRRLWSVDGSGAGVYFKVVVALFLFLDVMEVPLSWRKTRGGFQAEWIDLEGRVVSWADRLMRESHLLGREFRAGVGRLGFLAGVLSGASTLVRGGFESGRIFICGASPSGENCDSVLYGLDNDKGYNLVI